MTRLHLSPAQIDDTEVDRLLIAVKAAASNLDPWTARVERYNIEKAKAMNDDQDIMGEVARLRAIQAESDRRGR